MSFTKRFLAAQALQSAMPEKLKPLMLFQKKSLLLRCLLSLVPCTHVVDLFSLGSDHLCLERAEFAVSRLNFGVVHHYTCPV